MNINGTVANVTANALNQYTQVKGVIPQYDGNFNLSVYGQFGFTYDAEKRLTSASKSGVTQVECTYDGLGRVVRRIEQGVTTLYAYDEWKPILEFDAGGYLVAWNLYGTGADEIVARWMGATGTLWVHPDKQGSMSALLDDAGTVWEQYTYDAYGMPTILSANNTPLLTSAIGNRFMFTGREYLSSIAAYDYRHRMYRPNIGRFLQMDPIGFDAGDMNLFRYCGYDPVDRSDPTGLYGEEISNLEEAIHVARSNVLNEVRNPNRRTVSLHVDNGGAGRTIRYAPGISVSVLKAKSGNYELSDTLHGTPQKIQGKWYDVEPIVKGAVVPVHTHHDTGNGPGRAGWSDLDLKLKMVERMDESKPSWWHRGGLKNGVFTESRKPQCDDGSARKSGSFNWLNPQAYGPEGGPSSAPSAGDVDRAHQALGVPSLGAEAVNRVNGKLRVTR